MGEEQTDKEQVPQAPRAPDAISPTETQEEKVKTVVILSEDEQKSKDEKDSQELKIIVNQVTETNKVIDDAYDEKLRKLEVMKKLIPEDEKAEEDHKLRIQELNEKYQELMSRISAARKAGKDPFLAFVMSRSIQSKIKIAQVTREQRDFDQVKDIIAKAIAELQAAESEEVVNVKKELQQRFEAEKEAQAKATEAATIKQTTAPAAKVEEVTTQNAAFKEEKVKETVEQKKNEEELQAPKAPA